LQVRQCAYGIAENDAGVIEDFLEFRGRFGALVRGQICLATHVNRIEGAEESIKGGARYCGRARGKMEILRYGAAVAAKALVL
jgi:hypothetical protein